MKGYYERVQYYAKVVVSRIPVEELGDPIHTVDNNHCPVCVLSDGSMRVYSEAVRWNCGHTRSLPPIAPTGRSKGAR